VTDIPAVAATPKLYDAILWQDLPAGEDVALYHDGNWPAPKVAANGHPHVRWITVQTDYRNCSIIDLFEQPWWAPGKLRMFVRGRMGQGMDAIVYTDQAAAAEQWAALDDDENGQLLSYGRLFWWVATRDDGQPSAADLAADLAARWAAPIPAGRIWANQYTSSNQYDTSNRFISW
jgi:hypothetical protein